MMSEIVSRYFNSWLRKDSSVIEECFSKDIVYTECYGPVYKGRDQCLRWFRDWNAKGSVIAWDIKKVLTIDTGCIVEWYFACDYENKRDGFDGVSIVEFDGDGLISSIQEFQSASEHYYPYGE